MARRFIAVTTGRRGETDANLRNRRAFCRWQRECQSAHSLFQVCSLRALIALVMRSIMSLVRVQSDDIVPPPAHHSARPSLRTA